MGGDGKKLSGGSGMLKKVVSLAGQAPRGGVCVTGMRRGE